MPKPKTSVSRRSKPPCEPKSTDCILHGDAIRMYARQGSELSSLVFNSHGDVILCNRKRKTEGVALVCGTNELILNWGRQFKKGVRVVGDLTVEGDLVVTGDLTVDGQVQLPNLGKTRQPTERVLVGKRTGKLYRGA